MGYLKSAFVGIVTGLGGAVAWAILWLFLPLAPMGAGESGGFAAGSIGLKDMILPSIAGFGLGFYLMLRRQRTRPSSSRHVG